MASQVVQLVKKKKNPLAKAEDTGDVGSISGLERSPGVRNGNPFQYSCLGDPMDRDRWATAYGVARAGHD